MVRRLACALLAVLFLTAIPEQVHAAVRTGSVRVELDYGEDLAEGGEVKLCWIGTRTGEDYRLNEFFGGGIIRGGDIQSPELAQWLADLTQEQGVTQSLGTECFAEFTDLEEGLYLLVQTQAPEGYYKVSPFLITMPYADQWRILAKPKTRQIFTESPQTGQPLQPVLGSIGMIVSGIGLLFCSQLICRRKRNGTR